MLREDHRLDFPASGKDYELIRKLDAGTCLRLMHLHWRDIFQNKFRRERRTRSWVHELIETRNSWAHTGHEDWTSDNAGRALDTMIRLVEQIDTRATERLRTLHRTVLSPATGSSTPFARSTTSAETESFSNQNLDDFEPTVVDEDPLPAGPRMNVDERRFIEKAHTEEYLQRLKAREWVFLSYGAAVGIWVLAGISWWIEILFLEILDAWWSCVILIFLFFLSGSLGVWFGKFLGDAKMFSTRFIVAPDGEPGSAQDWKRRHLCWALGAVMVAITAIVLVIKN